MSNTQALSERRKSIWRVLLITGDLEDGSGSTIALSMARATSAQIRRIGGGGNSRKKK